MIRAAFVGALTLAPAIAAAQSACAPHDIMATHLADKFGEARQFIGLSASGAVMEVFASAESGTWTVTMTRPGGLTCIVAGGIAFEAEPPVAIGDPT